MIEIDGKPACAIIPSDRELSMKKVAAALGGKTAQMLRVRLDDALSCVPEMSANKYVLNIRFLTQGGEDPRPRTAEGDIGFELTFCNL